MRPVISNRQKEWIHTGLRSWAESKNYRMIMAPLILDPKTRVIRTVSHHAGNHIWNNLP
jgi:hypothetical protein